MTPDEVKEIFRLYVHYLARNTDAHLNEAEVRRKHAALLCLAFPNLLNGYTIV
jgi:hypothetical protein